MALPDADDPSPSFMEWPLIDRPGFLIRRMHQIHVALFAEYCGAFDITPVQNSILWALARRGPADQTTIATEICLDRTTTVGAIKRLVARRLVARAQSRTDRRAQLCEITPQGTALLAKIEAFARAAHHDTLAVLNAREQKTFLALMKRVVLAAPPPKPSWRRPPQNRSKDHHAVHECSTPASAPGGLGADGTKVHTHPAPFAVSPQASQRTPLRPLFGTAGRAVPRDHA